MFKELKNATGDGELIGRALTKAGFTVSKATNLSSNELSNVISRFAKDLPENAEAVFFFSGHGLELGIQPCLLGTDAVLRGDGKLESGEVFVSDIVSLISGASPRVGLFFFDCCREILDQRHLKSDGLRRIVNRSGEGYPEMMISFSSDPGGFALDGRELGLAESPYASSLAAGISSGRELTGLMKKVRQEVFRISGGRQRPWESSSLIGDFFFSEQEFTLPSKASTIIGPEEKDGDSKPVKAQEKSEGDFWAIYRFKGMDYVSLKNLAKFYGFPKVTRSDGHTELEHPDLLLHFVDGTSEMRVNENLFFMSFPSVVSGDELLIPTVDLTKLIDPVLRPSRIKDWSQGSKLALVFEGSSTTADGTFEDSLAKLSKEAALPIAYLISNSEKERAEWLTETTEEGVRGAILFRFDVPGIPPNSIRTSTLAPQGTPPTGGRASEILAFRLIGNDWDAANIALATSAHAFLLHSSELVDLGIGRTLFPEMRSIVCPAALVEMGRFEGGVEGNTGKIGGGGKYWQNSGVEGNTGKIAESIVEALRRFTEATASATTVVKWYRKAAEQGDAGAQFNLGACYKNGNGVPQDYAEAVKWYRLAADQGYARAQIDLGWCYHEGNGVPQDYAEAVKWYRL
ncbi:caspase family protein, partial [Verrucomicrobiales bacterium]|nr:caspase family protein [Verrucomicrobiales bacterium]